MWTGGRVVNRVVCFDLKILCVGTSLVAQWFGIRLPVQGTWVRALVWEDPTCRGATKPVRHNYWACALGPMSHNYWSPRATTTETPAPGARALQREKPQQWGARIPNWRKPMCSNKDPTQPKINNKSIYFLKKDSLWIKQHVNNWLQSHMIWRCQTAH